VRPSADLAPRLWDPLSPVASSGCLLLYPPYFMRAPPRRLGWRTVSHGLGPRIGRRTVVRVCWWVWMVVRFVCVIRVPVCARVSRVCPSSPRCVILPLQNCLRF
jgi:hypothetical protein